jgi:hypothetical protein
VDIFDLADLDRGILSSFAGTGLCFARGW